MIVNTIMIVLNELSYSNACAIMQQIHLNTLENIHCNVQVSGQDYSVHVNKTLVA